MRVWEMGKPDGLEEMEVALKPRKSHLGFNELDRGMAERKSPEVVPEVVPEGMVEAVPEGILEVVPEVDVEMTLQLIELKSFEHIKCDPPNENAKNLRKLGVRKDLTMTRGN